MGNLLLWISLLLGMLFFTGLVLALFQLRKGLGLAPLAVALGAGALWRALLVMAWEGQATLLVVAGWAASVAAAHVLAALLVYRYVGRVAARRLAYGVLFSNVGVFVGVVFFGWHLHLLAWPGLSIPSRLLSALPLRVMFVVPVVLFADMMLAMPVHAWLRKRLAHFLWLRLYLTLFLVLAFDSLAFSVGVFLGQPLFLPALTAGLLGAGVVALYYAAALRLYLRLVKTSPLGDAVFAMRLVEQRASFARKTARPVAAAEHRWPRKTALRLKAALWNYLRSFARLWRSAAHYRGIFDGVRDAILIESLDGRILDVNESACRMFGYSREEFLTKTVDDLVPPEATKVLPALCGGAVPAHPVETVNLRANGEAFPVELTARLGSLGDEEVMLVVLRDISERKRIEQALRESEERFRALAESTTAGLFVTVGEHFVYVNPAAEKLTGYSRKELTSMRFWEVVHPDFQEMLRQRGLARQRGENPPSHYEFKIVRKDGEERWLDLTAARIEWEGKPGLITSVFDVTERKRAEQALRESEARFRTYMERATDFIFALDTAGHFTFVNYSLCRALGYKPQELLGKPALTLIPPEARQPVVRVLQKIWQGETVDYVDAPVQAKDGRTLLVRIRGRTLKHEGRIVETLHIARDITAQKRHQRQLEAQAMLAQALGETLELEPLLERLLEAARHAIPAAEKGSILLLEANGRLRIRALSGYSDPRMKELAFAEESGYAARTARQRQPLLIADVRADPSLRYDGEVAEARQILSAITAPLLFHDRVIGVISLDATRKAAFTPEDLGHLIHFAATAALIIENARLYRDATRRLAWLEALRQIDLSILSSLDLPTSLDVLLQHLQEQLGVDAAAVLLFDPEAERLVFARGRGFRTQALQDTCLRLGQGYAGRAAQERRVVHVPDLGEMAGSPFKCSPLFAEEGFVGYLGVPLLAQGTLVGVLEIFHRAPLEPDEEWRAFLHTLAGQAAIAIDRVRLFNELRRAHTELLQAYDATIEGWARALELRDMETTDHSRRVVAWTLKLARRLGVPEEDLVHIRRGALLHDIGKMGVPDAILRKPGPLTEEEWAIMRQHPVYAYELLSPIAYLRPALDIPHYHHERWDGSGYPHGLKGEEIPLPARIFAVVDVWDALTTDRPYRPAWPREKALAYLRENSGKLFDPRVVAAFLEMMVEEEQEGGGKPSDEGRKEGP